MPLEIFQLDGVPLGCGYCDTHTQTYLVYIDMWPIRKQMFFCLCMMIDIVA